MYLMFFGLVVLVVGLSITLLRTTGAPGHRVTLFRLLGAAITVVGVLLTLSTGFTVIGVGETGVVHAFGRVDPAPVVSGIHLIRPWASVEQFRVREIQFPGAGATEVMD